MTAAFRGALSVSIGLHAAVLAGVPLMTTPVAFDVERAPTSVELVLLTPAPSTPAPVPLEVTEAPAVRPEVSQPQTPPAIASEASRGAQVDRLPSYLRNPPPIYPQVARERGYEGTVVLDVEVLASGEAGAVRVLESSGHDVLDEAAVRALRQWRFRPARRWRHPVTFWVEIPITFRLVDAGSLGMLGEAR